MSYAIRLDGAGWRAVDGPDDCLSDEVWQERRPPIPEITSIGDVRSPQEKLASFLASNPDVLDLINQGP